MNSCQECLAITILQVVKKIVWIIYFVRNKKKHVWGDITYSKSKNCIFDSEIGTNHVISLKATLQRIRPWIL